MISVHAFQYLQFNEMQVIFHFENTEIRHNYPIETEAVDSCLWKMMTNTSHVRDKLWLFIWHLFLPVIDTAVMLVFWTRH